MARLFLTALALGCLLNVAYSQNSYTGPDQHGVQTVCAGNDCRNALGMPCQVMTVRCDDFRCYNSPSKLMCALINACITAWCHYPSPSPSVTPSPSATPSITPTPSATPSVTPSASVTPSPSLVPKLSDLDHCEGTRERKALACMKNKQRYIYRSVFQSLSKDGTLADFTSKFDNNVWEATGGVKWLPWARTILRRFENMGREHNSEFVIPYWDFTATSKDIAASEVWEMKNGFGISTDGKCIRKSYWFGFKVDYPEEHCIKRDFSEGSPVDGITAIQNLVANAKSFQEFSDTAEYVWHRVRETVGGECATRVGPNDPMFYPLLATFDYIWTLWQKENPDAIFGGEHRDHEISADDGLEAFGGNKISDILSSECVEYSHSCMSGEDPDILLSSLSEDYMRANKLPVNRMWRTEGTAFAILYGEEDEVSPSPDN